MSVLLAALLAVGGGTPALAAGGSDRAAGTSDVGLLVVDHGEPPEYNEDTYWSFRAFFGHLLDMGVMPSWLRLVDTGTIVANRNCFGCPPQGHAPDLVDAWLRPHDGPAAFVPASDRLPAHYVKPGGPGLGEPDIFEHIGLAAWHEWEQMGGRSPNYDQKLAQKDAVIAKVRRGFGSELPVRVGYGIDPRIDGGRQGIREAVLALVNQDRVDHIVVAYHGVGFSDLMQTHMLRHEINHVLAQAAPNVSVSYAAPLGSSSHYVRAVVEEVASEVGALPRGAAVAVQLSGHGLPRTMCGDYDCASDGYHAYSENLFSRTAAAVRAAIRRPGRFGVYRSYGDAATGDDDPRDEVDSPLEALAKRADEGYRYVIDIPYEFAADSRDTLIVLRRGYERTPPEWDRAYESRFRYRGMDVKIGNASFGFQGKVDASYDVIARALGLAGAGERRR